LKKKINELITEEDLMNTLTARDIMTTEILGVKADWPLDRLAEFLVENSISGAPVLSDEGKLLGVVSLTDIVRHTTLPLKERHRNKTHEYYLPDLKHQYSEEEIPTFDIRDEFTTTVSDIMNTVIFNVEEDAIVRDIADIMIRGRIHRIFVTRKDQVVGIISALDMLKVIMEVCR
jgi:CBS domain-containing protein